MDIKENFYSPFNFVLAVEVFMRPTLNTYPWPFLRKSVSVATSRLRIFTLLLPIVAGVALDMYFRKPEGAAISSYKHWRISPLSLGLR
jgi:hypothetical protein